MNNQENVRPRLQLLNSEQMKQIHQYSIRILENTGIKVESKTALDIFKKSKSVKIKNETVYIQAELIHNSIKQAPSSIDIYNKKGGKAFSLGKKQGNETYFGVGVTNTFFQEIGTNELVPFRREHFQCSTKLGDMLANFDMISTLGIPSDVAADEADLYSTLDMYANTDKPLVLLISESKNMNRIFELLSFLHGEIASKPFCIPYFNPITPLVLNESTSDKMIASIRFNLPIMYSNYSMYGGTSPVTAGGTLALLNAELLAGLVFGQLIREGNPMILGSLPAAFNMMSMGSYYTPESYLLNLACAEMMDFYELPHCGTSGSNNGWGPDLIASGQLWQNHLTSCLGKIGCAPFVGGNFDSMAFSPALVVLSNQIIGEARKFAKGFTLNDEIVDLNEINQVSHGGNYLTSEQTLASLAESSSNSSLWTSLNPDSWKSQGMPKAQKILIDHTLDLYAKAKKASEQNIDLIKKGEDFILNSLQ